MDANNGNTADTADSISVTVTTVADNSWIVDMVSKVTNSGNLTVGTGQTEQQNLDGATNDHGMSTVGPKTPAGAEAMDWNDGGSILTFDWAISAASFCPENTCPAAGGAAVPDLNSDTHIMIQDTEIKIEDQEVMIID